MILIILMVAATLSSIIYEPLGWFFIALALGVLVYQHAKDH